MNPETATTQVARSSMQTSTGSKLCTLTIDFNLITKFEK